ncbi:YbjN domain-containing protein [Leptolyngbya sp. PL-A3]|nr:YbjN domain-containing protein [Leptolyngbya sp. FACHB-8]MBD1909761.1 YbjN domain-containing protein [Leptolyngbya sp. FACHB-8]MBD2157659.1 YbjN domain-containing protein [Leptolyngbya sp. FACHB-16]
MNLDELPQSISNVLEQELSPSKQMFDQLITFFANDDWSFTRLHGEPILYTSIQGKNGEWNCYAHIRGEQAQFAFYSICPIATPSEKLLSIAEFITRVNSGMILGNFELDFEDGEIRYKTSIDVTDDYLSYALIKQLVYANISMMDAYLPGIRAVIAGAATPLEAIRQIEASGQVAEGSREIEESENVPVEV